MTRTEFDAAFKLALGYTISEEVFRFFNGSFMCCTFKENGINFNIENRKKFITYDELINFIPHIRTQIIDDGEKGRWVVRVFENVCLVLQR